MRGKISKETRKRVREAKKNYPYLSVRKIAKIFGISKSSASNILKEPSYFRPLNQTNQIVSITKENTPPLMAIPVEETRPLTLRTKYDNEKDFPSRLKHHEDGLENKVKGC